MRIRTKEVGDVVVIRVSGEVDLYSSPEIKKKIKRYCRKDKVKILVDLGKVTYIDSSGISSLISSVTSLKSLGGELKILRVYNTVKKIFDLTKLDTFFDIHDDEKKALAAFKDYK